MKKICDICQNNAVVETVLATQKRVKEIRKMSNEEFTKLRRRMESKTYAKKIK